MKKKKEKNYLHMIIKYQEDLLDLLISWVYKT